MYFTAVKKKSSTRNLEEKEKTRFQKSKASLRGRNMSKKSKHAREREHSF
jgi:hypothetical protein